ncbi:hypothetical protein SZ54_1945 [Rhizobium sp. UR51a]|nr:hypothetical protein SZ54_1945 [Rhizobium sp. UR51a]
MSKHENLLLQATDIDYETVYISECNRFHKRVNPEIDFCRAV